ncbi:hypothetical protein NEF87_002805 [Candidatus Lokiarchaeum ossiferum]|uniref:protein-serine/threonine phosphatase n=1 Tax=Candidatus Lokiarchaeum ossiferum TaxID=2951803 RepID=A0ABY6HSY2_9ARCH|nr:hypothetical protein NEF87_002805 [Candidatus Lokiarchaeum sp. B-35]
MNNKDEFGEIDEYNDRTRKIGHESYKSLQPTFIKIEETQTQMILDGKTQKLGESTESTIVEEFWEYYLQFSPSNLPNFASYYGNESAELKMTILIRVFQDFCLERVYPPSFPVPIIQKAFKNSKNNSSHAAKFFFVGDTHGSMIDTMRLVPFFVKEIEKGILNDYKVKIVFIGDFIDRNDLDIHNILYLMTFNLRYPNNVLLLRGNHEEISVCAHYGFGKKVVDRFSQMLFASFCNLFKDLPLMAIYHCQQGSVLCLHGGIPIYVDEETGKYKILNITTYQYDNRHVWLDDMDKISQQILWNDPIINYDPENMPPFFTSKRGMGYWFGEEVFDEFCEKNKISLIFRGHQVFLDGIHKEFRQRFITIFSASDYAKKKIKARFIEMNSDDIFNYKVHVIQDLP